jgi:LPS-assembly protein
MLIRAKKYILYPFLVLFVFVFLFFDIAHAAMYDETLPVDCQGDVIVYSDTHKEIQVKGNVVVTHGDARITADKVIYFIESRDIYASGKVILYRGEEIYSADKLYYNIDTKKGTLIHGNFKSGKIFGGANTVEKVSDKEIQALKGYITTCNFEKPHYRIESKKIRIYPNDRVVAKNVFFYMGNIPILYMPYYSHSLKENRPKVQIIPGHDKEWGYFLLTAWRYHLNDNLKGWLRFDWREKLGFGEGIDVEYNTNKFGTGIFKGYYTQERDRKIKESLPAEKDRYRVSLVHKWNVDSDTEAIAEVNKYSDYTFIKDYFYREYVDDPLPTTYLSLTRNKAHYSLSFLFRKRVNHFRTIVETLPELKYNINNYRLGSSRFYYTAQYQFDNFNKKEAYTGDDLDTVRFYTDNKISYPTRLFGYLNWLEFTPHVGRVETLYTKDRSGNDRDFTRSYWYSGYSLTTKVFRMFDVDGNYLGVEVNKLRHLISPSITFNYRHEPTADAGKVGQFDGLDGIDKAKYYTFALDNKLQTKWFVEGTYDKENADLILFRNSVDFYPQIEGHQWSYITNRLELHPKRWFEIIFDANYDPYHNDFDIFNARAKLSKSKWAVELSSRYTKSTQYHEGIFDAAYSLTPKWTLGVYERYDFQKNELVEQEYSFKRDLHCWTGELIWNIEEGETIWLVFTPKAFPDFPVEWVTSYHAPKAGSQSLED